MLAWALSQYRDVDVISRDVAYAEVSLPYGRAPLDLVAARPLAASARLGTLLTERVVVPRSTRLPVRAGARLGRIEVFDQGRLIGERPLLAARSVAAPGVLGRIGWYVHRSLHDLVRLVT
jgi:hypothetical protein